MLGYSSKGMRIVKVGRVGNTFLNSLTAWIAGHLEFRLTGNPIL